MKKKKTTSRPTKYNPRKVTRRSLENIAIYYLKRYTSTSYHLRKILARRLLSSQKYHGTDISEGNDWIEEIIMELTNKQILDDKRYAVAKSDSLRREGKSMMAIKQKLIEKGITNQVIKETLKNLTGEFLKSEEIAANQTAKRRRLGPYRATSERKKYRVKDLASLFRAGFDYNTAILVIDGEGKV